MPKTKKLLETTTSEALEKTDFRFPTDPVDEILTMLVKVALKEESVSAAKLYLDYITRNRSDEPVGLTAEEAIRLLLEKK